MEVESYLKLIITSASNGDPAAKIAILAGPVLNNQTIIDIKLKANDIWGILNTSNIGKIKQLKEPDDLDISIDSLNTYNLRIWISKKFFWIPTDGSRNSL